MHYSFDNCPGNEILEKSKGNFFVLLFVGRTGSTFTIDVFNQHPDVKFEGEWIGTFKDKLDSSILQIQWIRSLFSSENTSSYYAIGFKTKFYDIPDKSAFRQSLIEFRPTILMSQRRNLIKQAISILRINRFAELKKQEMDEKRWKQSKTNNKVWNIFKQGDGIGKIRLDVQAVHGWVLEMERSAKKLQDFMNSLDLDIIFFDYEDIIRDTPLFFEKMFRLLGVEPINFKTRVFKHTADDLSNAIENFEELQDFYNGTKYEQFFV